MSIDLERYADLYGKFGDADIERLLKKAAVLSRRRGRPEIVYVDNPLTFRLRETRLVREMEQHRQLQEAVVGFFTQEAPIGTSKALPDIAYPFHRKVGVSLQHEVFVSDLLLPARSRTTGDRQEKLLLQESQKIAPSIKNSYNRMLQSCIRAGLARIGDVKNVVNLNGDLLIRHMTSSTANFLRIAL